MLLEVPDVWAIRDAYLATLSLIAGDTFPSSSDEGMGHRGRKDLLLELESLILVDFSDLERFEILRRQQLDCWIEGQMAD